MASLFDVFSDSGGKKAAKQAYSSQTTGYNKGFDAAQGYGDRAIDALYGGQDDAIGAIDSGGDRANKFYNQGIKPQRQLYNTGKKGIDFYGDLVGLGGADMSATLANIPGYQFAQEQGLDALNRTANARGMLASGNNTQDILRFSQGLADQNYFNYLNALNPYFGLAQSGAAGMQQGYDAKAANATNQGANKANIYTGTAANVANVNTGLGNQAYNTQTGIGQAGADLAQNQYAAEQGASQNMWNAILGIGNMATGGIANYVGAGGRF